MTVLEKFMSFARQLPADRLRSVEEALAAVMETYSEEYDFTDAERRVLDQRVAEARPCFSDPADIAKLLGKPFSA